MIYCAYCFSSFYIYGALFPPVSAIKGIKLILSVCVSVSVSQRFDGWTIWCTDPKFGTGHHLDNISDDFEGHRLRSPSWRRDFQSFRWVDLCRFTSFHVMWCYREMSQNIPKVKCASISVEYSYRPVARGYLFLGQGYLFSEAGSPGRRPKKAISQLLQIPQNSITTRNAVQEVDWAD